jgi:hypothetical protein
MRQVKEFSDKRNKGFCVHCGGPHETDDHVPSKVLLDEPFPENLSTSPSCQQCNNEFSKDEEYLACVLECVICGTAEPDKIERTKIAGRLKNSPKLKESIAKCRRVEDGQTIWDVKMSRIKKVILKLARGHASFELAEPQTGEPSGFFCKPIIAMTDKEKARFENEPHAQFSAWPEVGSRTMSRALVLGSDVYDEGFLVVQEGRYRFRALQENGVTIQMILREYLACEVVWN